MQEEIEKYKLLIQNSDIETSLNLLDFYIKDNSIKKKAFGLFYAFLDSNQKVHLLNFNGHHGALSCIYNIIKNSKGILSMANDMNKIGNFTSISQKTAQIIQELQEWLIDLLESSDRVMLFKILSLITCYCKYETLSRGQEIRHRCMSKSIEIIQSDSDSQVIIQGLNLVKELLDSSFEEIQNLEILTLLLNLKNQDLSVKISVYGVLGAFIRNFQDYILLWTRFKGFIDTGIRDSVDLLREAALKCFFEYAERLKKENTLENNTLEWWNKSCQIFLLLLDDESSAVRSMALDTLSLISSDAFSKLPPKMVFSIQSVSIGMLADTIPTVRASACGILGVLITFSSVQGDLLFFSDLLGKIPHITTDDESLVVRVRASWALANICAALVEIRKNNLDDFSIPDMHLRKCVEASLFASKDREKCRSNGVRALGNIFPVLPSSWIQNEVEGLLKEIIVVLIKNVNTGPVKTRWNACHAIANILKSSHFPASHASFTDILLESLQEAMISSKNFKVRIAATTALGAVRLSWFGQEKSQQTASITALLKSLDLAITKTDDLVGSEFGEFKYQQQLKEKIIATQHHFNQLKLNQDKS